MPEGSILAAIKAEKDPEVRRQLQILASRKGKKDAETLKAGARARAVTPRGGGTITVKAGDNYFALAEQLYGDQRFAEQIAKANGGLTVLQAGMKLKIPRLNASRSPIVSGAFMARAAGLGQELTGLGATNAFGGGRTFEDIEQGLADQFGGTGGRTQPPAGPPSAGDRTGTAPAGTPATPGGRIPFPTPAAGGAVPGGAAQPAPPFSEISNVGIPSLGGAPSPSFSGSFSERSNVGIPSSLESQALQTGNIQLPQFGGTGGNVPPAAGQATEQAAQAAAAQGATPSLSPERVAQIKAGFDAQAKMTLVNANAMGILTDQAIEVHINSGLYNPVTGKDTSDNTTSYDINTAARARLLNPVEARVALPPDYYKRQRGRRSRRSGRNPFPSSNPVGFNRYSNPTGNGNSISPSSWRIGF